MGQVVYMQAWLRAKATRHAQMAHDAWQADDAAIYAYHLARFQHLRGYERRVANTGRLA